MRKLLWLALVASALATSAAWAQDDNPYGEPAAQPAPPPKPPAPRPPSPPAGARPGQPATGHPAAPPPPAHPPAPPPTQPPPAPPTHEAAPAHAPSFVPELPAPVPPPAEPAAPAAHEPEAAPQPEMQHGAHGQMAPAHGATEPAHGEEHAAGAHGAEHGAEHAGHDAPPAPMNWFYGFLGTDAEAEPSLMWRKPDMPPPFAANLINFAIFAYVIVRYGKKPLQEALAARKKTIMQDIDSATKMHDDASKRLAQYEDRLKHIDDEIERIKKDFREQGERDKERILSEAKEKRDRMLKDAQFLIEQEAKQLRIDLVRETVDAAMKAAEQILVQKVTSADHDRVAEEFLSEVAKSRGLGVSKGGNA